MLLETPQCLLSCSGRVAHLELRGAALADVARALAAIRAHPFVEILVVHGGANAIDDATTADPIDGANDGANDGRRLLRDWEASPVVTLAYLTGPTTGRWFELALACDYRVAVATPDAGIGFHDKPRWGSFARLRRLIGRDDVGGVTPREAQAMGLVDAACCERRAKIELNSWIDRLEDRPRKRRHSWWAERRAAGADSRELAAFLADVESDATRIHDRRELPLDAIELRRCPQAVPFAVEFLLRGGTVVTDDPEAIGERLDEPLARGRVTPLEAEQARNRVRGTGRAKLVLEGESNEPFAIVRAVLAPHVRPIRLGFPVRPESRVVELTTGTANPSLSDLMVAVGYDPIEVPDAPLLAIRPALAAYWDEALRLAAEGHAFDRIAAASAAVARHAPLRTLDALGAVAAATLAPRLRPFADACLHEIFYHADRPHETNALAAAMLGAGPRAMIEEDDHEELADDAARELIVRRLRARIADLDPAIARAAGFSAERAAPRSIPADRRAA